MDWTGSSITMKRNGLSGSVARGTNRLSAHHAEGGPGDAVDGDVEDHAATRPVARELDPPQLHVALLAQALPDPCGLLRDGSEAVVADPRRRLLEPGLRGLEALEVRGSAHRLPRAGQPVPDLRSHRPPGVLLAPELGSGGLPQAKDRLAQRPARRLHVGGEITELGDRSRLDPDPERLDELPQVQTHLARALEGLRLQDREVLPPPSGGFGPRVGGLRLLRGVPQPLHGRPLLLAPGAVEGALAATDRAVAVAMGGVKGEGQVEELGRITGAGGGRAHGGSESLRRPAHLPHRVRHTSGVRRLEARDRPQHLGLARGHRRRAAGGEDRFHGAEIPVLALDGRHHAARPLVVNRPQSLEKATPPFGRVLQGLLTRAAGLLKRALGKDEVLETEDRGKGVVELRGSFVEERAQLVVGKERAMGAQGWGPAERVELGVRPAGEVDCDFGDLEGGTVFPPSRNDAGPRLAFHEERGAHGRRGMMEVPPAVPPDGGALFPAQAVARQEHLQGFGEARFAGAVAPHDEGEARARGQLQVLRGADATKALDGDRAQEGTVGSRRRLRHGRRGRGGSPRQLRLEAVAASEGAEDEGTPAVPEETVRLEPRQHDPPQTRIHT
jgi:hypothetical protein